MLDGNIFDLTGRVVIVTGGAGLLGREYVKVLSRAGAHAVVADYDYQGALIAASNCTGAEPFAVRLDVSDPLSVRAVVAAVLAKFGRIDGLVNNAALDPKFEKGSGEVHTDAFEQYPLELWNAGIAVNLTGMFLCAQAVIPTMLKAGKGAIVNICSTYGLVGPDQRLYESDDPSVPKRYKPVIYSVTKSAVVGLTKYLAAYYADQGIRVNILTPGGVYNNHPEEFVRRYAARTPMNRMADSREYNGALVYLLSDASSYMTGSNVVVDGGWTAW